LVHTEIEKTDSLGVFQRRFGFSAVPVIRSAASKSRIIGLLCGLASMGENLQSEHREPRFTLYNVDSAKIRPVLSSRVLRTCDNGIPRPIGRGMEEDAIYETTGLA
jgi:hypothetical protein